MVVEETVGWQLVLDLLHERQHGSLVELLLACQDPQEVEAGEVHKAAT